MIPAIGITEDGTPFTMTSVYKEKVGDELRKQNASCMAYSKDEVVLMQFTGLQDKNGKDIWEGDKVMFGSIYTEVVFKDGCFVFEGTGYEATMRDHGTHEFEIIGNIYEHPHLKPQHSK
jgi:uncharacterized phage protein (TIGR01671 family)